MKNNQEIKFMNGVYWNEEDIPNGTMYKDGDNIYGIAKFRINGEIVNVMFAEYHDLDDDIVTCYRKRISDTEYRRYGCKGPHIMNKWQMKEFLKNSITYMG